MVLPSMRTGTEDFAEKVQHVWGRGPGASGVVRALLQGGPTFQERNLGVWLESAVSIRERMQGKLS